MPVQLPLWEDPPEKLAFPAPATIPGAISAPVVEVHPPAVQLAGAPRITRDDKLSTLKTMIRHVETARHPQQAVVSTGAEVLDAVLPAAGYPAGSLVEWIAVGGGSGAGWLAMHGARAAYEASGGKVVVIDQEKTFYPPAVIAMGLPAEAIILLRPNSRADALWAINQSLRSPAVAAVWSELPRLEDTEARRLQLAAETGGSLGMFVRNAAALGSPSWAEVRWQVRGEPKRAALTPEKREQSSRRLSVTLLRVRGGKPQGPMRLEIDSAGLIHKEPHHESTRSASAQRLAAELAHPKIASRKRASGLSKLGHA